MIWLMDEEYDEVSACLGLSKGGIHVLATTMAILHEAEYGIASDDLTDFLARNPMLAVYLLDDRVEPDDPSYLHRMLILPRRRAAVKVVIGRATVVLGSGCARGS